MKRKYPGGPDRRRPPRWSAGRRGALQIAETLDRLLREGRRSVLLDMSAVTSTHPARWCCTSGRWDSAVASYEQAMAADPAFPLAQARYVYARYWTVSEPPESVITALAAPLSP